MKQKKYSTGDIILLRLVALPRTELGRAGPPGWEEASKIPLNIIVLTADPLRLVALPRAELGRAGPPSWEEASSRRVERGSRLVIAVPKHSR